MQLHPQVQALLQDCIQLRQALHRIPETGFDLFKTHAFVMEQLESCGPDRLETLATTGIKAVFLSPGAQETIALRADMDGIPTSELTEAPYASTHPGSMHGCGHDGHMTMLLLAARLIRANREKLTKNVVLLFQPAEEGKGGARIMIQEGALEHPHVDRIYGMHVWPTVTAGKVGVRWGPMMAQTCEFDMLVHGKSAHGASPQMGVDAIVCAAELITVLQTAITRNVDPHQDVLLTIGKIQGGVAHNVIADEVKLSGTLRVFSPAVYDQLRQRVGSMVQGLSMATGAKFEFKELMHYPCVNNPRPLVEDFYTYLDSMEDVELVEPVMAAEDFAYYQQSIPGLFVFLGIQAGKNQQPLHNCKFDFDEENLLLGVELYARLIGLWRKKA